MNLVLEIGNSVGDPGGEPIALARRAYVRGLACYPILELRDRVLGLERGTSTQQLSDGEAARRG